MSLLKKFEKHWHQVLFFILLLAAICLAGWLSLNVHSLYRAGVRPEIHHRYLRSPLSASQVQGWMTFSYINHIFSLPEDYLSTKLSIADSRYPDMTIDQYAKTKTLDATSFVHQVQDSVSQYLQGRSQ